MMEFLMGFALGFSGCLVLLYWIGTTKHQGHGDKLKKTTGPSSKTHMSENVVVHLSKKG